MMIKAAYTTGVRRVLGFAEISDEVEAHMNVPQLEAYINYLLTEVHEDGKITLALSVGWNHSMSNASSSKEQAALKSLMQCKTVGDVRAWGDVHANLTTELAFGGNPGLLSSNRSAESSRQVREERPTPDIARNGAVSIGLYGHDEDPVYYAGFTYQGEWCSLYYTEGKLKSCYGGELGDSAPEGFKVRLRNRPFDVGPANWIPYSNVQVAGSNQSVK